MACNAHGDRVNSSKQRYAERRKSTNGCLAI